MDIFKAIKENVTARQAAELYGLKVSANGMACCPFHDDHNPSLKLDERYYCFGCQATGDAIDFTSAYLQLTPLEAVKKLAEDFRIPYDANQKEVSAVPVTERLKALKAQQAQKAFLEWKRRTLSDLAGFYRILEDCKSEYAPQTRDEPWSPFFVQSCHDQSLVDLYTWLLENAPETDQHALYDERTSTIDALAKRVSCIVPSQGRRSNRIAMEAI